MKLADALSGMIRIVISTDSAGMRWNATLIASVLRRASQGVEVRVYTRGFEEASFEVPGLKVDFFQVSESASGRYPGHVPDAVFDRLRIIKDEPDWERVLILDHDMVVLCDLAPYFDEDFEDSLLMGRLFGEGNTLGLQMKQRGGLPAAWSHCVEFPYFYMGPMLNLRLMRHEGTWEKLLAAHEAIGEDEQISLTAATDGRVKGVAKKWNLVPQWDRLEELQHKAGNRSSEIGGVQWNRGVPEGVIHWTGPAKPWHFQSRVWRPEIWESERVSWEHLRLGLWQKPEILDVFPLRLEESRAMAKRGWNVRAVIKRHDDVACSQPGFPDLEVVQAASDDVLEFFSETVVRLGPEARLDSGILGQLPETFSLTGPRSVEDVEILRDAGFLKETRYIAKQWPLGGPHPDELEYWEASQSRAISFNEVAAFSRRPKRIAQLPSVPKPASYVSSVDYRVGHFLEFEMGGLLADSGRVIELGYGRHTELLTKAFPGTEIIVISEDARSVEVLERFSSGRPVRVIHAPLGESFGWYEIDGADLPSADLLVVDGPDYKPCRAARGGAVSLIEGLEAKAFVLLCGTEFETHRALLPMWLEAGCRTVVEGYDFILLRKETVRVPSATEEPAPIRIELNLFVECAYFATDVKNCSPELESSEDHRDTLGIQSEIVTICPPDEGSILWKQIRGFEADGLMENLKGDYIVKEIGRLLTMRGCLQRFVELGKRTALVVEKGLHWGDHARDRIESGLAELPSDWDLVILHAMRVDRFKPIRGNMARLVDFVPGRAAIWSVESAVKVLEALESADKEFPMVLHALAKNWMVYGLVPFPCKIGL